MSEYQLYQLAASVTSGVLCSALWFAIEKLLKKKSSWPRLFGVLVVLSILTWFAYSRVVPDTIGALDELERGQVLKCSRIEGWRTELENYAPQHPLINEMNRARIECHTLDIQFQLVRTDQGSMDVLLEYLGEVDGLYQSIDHRWHVVSDSITESKQ